MDYKDSILCTLLDCGVCDLTMLEDIKYDLWDILKDMIANKDMNINSIFRGVFEQARFDLNSAFEEEKDDICEAIKDEMERYAADAKEDGVENFDEEDEYIKLIEYRDLLDAGEINPEEDLTYYLNYMDTHVALKHYDFYFLWMRDHVLRIENLMGFEFEEGEW